MINETWPEDQADWPQTASTVQGGVVSQPVRCEMKLNVQQRGASVLLLQSTAPADGESDLVAEVHTSSEDARRIAACWNACAGISTENLEGNLPFNRQRDQLLGLLEGTVHVARQAGFGIKPPLADVLLVFAERVIDKIKDEIKGGAECAAKVEDQREMLANAIEEMRNLLTSSPA